MGEGKEVGYKDWDDIVKTKKASLEVIEANEISLIIGRVIENLIMERAIIERDKYPKPPPDTMAEEENKEEEEKEEEKKEE